MRRALLLLPLTLGACTGTVGDPALWAKACERSLTTVDDLTPETLAECKTSMAAHPPSVSDDMARCILDAPAGASADEERSAFKACISPATKDHLDRRTRAQTQLDELGGKLHDRKQDGETLPATLAELTPPPANDPWDNPFAYERTEDGFELCSLGPDGQRGTRDDLCFVQPFIYFQF